MDQHAAAWIEDAGVAGTRFVGNTIPFPYRRLLGPLLTTFMTARTQKRLLGSRSGDRIFVPPPMEWDPQTGADLGLDLIEVGPVESWTWVPHHPLKNPFAFAFIRFEGASTPLLHAVDAGSPDRITNGASGLLRFAEAANQVRGVCGEMLIENAKTALGMAYGANSQCFSTWVVGSSRRPFG